MELAIIGTGSNLGNRLQYLNAAMELLSNKLGEIDRASQVYSSSPWGKTDQPEFLNQVFGIYTNKDPVAVMEILLSIELSLGRERKEKWGARSIDMDLLYQGSHHFKSRNLTLPHPGIPQRKFVLVPLAEIYPDFIHPENGMSQIELLNQCNDQGTVHIYNEAE